MESIKCYIMPKLVGCVLGMGFAPTWLSQVSPLLHMTILTTVRVSPVYAVVTRFVFRAISFRPEAPSWFAIGVVHLTVY